MKDPCLHPVEDSFHELVSNQLL